ncbi:hypothetical protein CASFOL_022979 [Castilleja foliolosa]|uniref:Uncharacterized protein n=1 Tax=Castilleja foliolosa TaxID=1961234 RepID=A0ABD3CUQ2_9LAMI
MPLSFISALTAAIAFEGSKNPFLAYLVIHWDAFVEKFPHKRSNSGSVRVPLLEYLAVIHLLQVDLLGLGVNRDSRKSVNGDTAKHSLYQDGFPSK